MANGEEGVKSTPVPPSALAEEDLQDALVVCVRFRGHVC